MVRSWQTHLQAASLRKDKCWLPFASAQNQCRTWTQHALIRRAHSSLMCKLVPLCTFLCLRTEQVSAGALLWPQGSIVNNDSAAPFRKHWQYLLLKQYDHLNSISIAWLSLKWPCSQHVRLCRGRDAGCGELVREVQLLEAAYGDVCK